ncbi:hypothetical protein Tco_0482997, partial [Tanacetum coccineum]
MPRILIPLRPILGVLQMEDTQSSIRNGLLAESYAKKNLNNIVKKIEENLLDNENPV